MWDNYHDAKMRLNGSVVRFGGKPVVIIEVDPGLNAHMKFLLTSKEQIISLADRGWDWSPVGTGYVNTDRGCHYLHRRPARKWKQGLHSDNLQVLNPPDGPRARVGIHISREFGRTVMRDYPSFEQALEHVRKKGTGRAFSHMYSFLKSDIGLLWLHYRGEAVGWVEGDEVKLGEGFEFLAEELNTVRTGREVL